MEYAPVDGVLDELAERLRFEPAPDFIGLAGSGEPTLHSRIGEIIASLKRLTKVPVAVLTNGSLLWSPEVRAGLAEADLVLPSLDAGTQETFKRVNRPHPELSFEKVVDGLLSFSAGFKGKLWLEVFVLGGVSDRPEEFARIVSIAGRMRPERVQLNTVTRPPAEAHALAVSAELLDQLRGQFAGHCEVIAERRPAEPVGRVEGRCAEQEILALLNRRPCSVEGISDGLSLPPNEVLKHLDALLGRGAVRVTRRDAVVFYEGGGR
jgi:wyosine [tRNA(Phe)-imidazoG37] synthetase (radical SAM superfamily)